MYYPGKAGLKYYKNAELAKQKVGFAYLINRQPDIGRSEQSLWINDRDSH